MLIAQTLLPFGHALAFEGEKGIDYQAMCLPSGFKIISMEQDGTSTPASTPTNSVPCPLCTLHLTPTLPTPQNTATIIDAPTQRAVFGLRLQRARTSIWRNALRPSRAPPISV
ncbi:MAG: hypothetical protein KAQ66_06820 [Rhodospirillaceae bacterium]|nr:hypothetical protein [Rhodospirillaceae bacterium]